MTAPETDRPLARLASLLPHEAARGFLYIDEDGEPTWVGQPPSRGVDRGLEDTPSPPDDAQPGTRDLNPEPDCTSKTGPYRRVYTLPDRAGPANCMRATVRLPRGHPTGLPARDAPHVVRPEADADVGGFDEDELPFVYVGGWGPGLRGAVDAGFQYSKAYGNWQPFVAVELSKEQRDKHVKHHHTFERDPRFDGGATAHLFFFALDNLVGFQPGMSGDDGRVEWLSPMVVAMASRFGWNGAGRGLTFKRMTSIGQRTAASSSSRRSFVRGVAWSGATLGMYDPQTKAVREEREWTSAFTRACNCPGSATGVEGAGVVAGAGSSGRRPGHVVGSVRQGDGSDVDSIVAQATPDNHA